LLSTLFSKTGSVKEITWQQFENDILSKKVVDKLVVTNGENVQVYIKSQF
jgi:cell division protease FtsH